MIKNYCVDCDKELTLEEWEICFAKNHNIRSQGIIVIEGSNSNRISDGSAIFGVAQEDIKKGQIGRIEL